MTSPKACPCCGGDRFFEVAAFPDTPVSGIFRDLPDQPLASHPLAFESCTRCGLLRNRDFASPPGYEEKPRSTSRQLPVYHESLLSMIKASATESDLVVEIGSNDSAFLDLLRRNGFSNTYGVEPSTELAELSRARGFRVESGYFGPDTVQGLLDRYGPVKMAICRHTLEHVPDPAAFVGALRNLLVSGGACALVEVPESTVIAERMNFVELWDEHLYYFTAQSLRRIFERNGLEVRTKAIYPHLDTRNLVMLVALAEAISDSVTSSNPLNEAGLWQDFSGRFEVTSAKLRDVVMNAPLPLYVIGASHPQCNFVNYLGIEDRVDAMIDDDPFKQGKFPAVRSAHVPVISSAEFAARPGGGTLVLTGFGYPEWTARLVEAAATRGLSIIDPADSYVLSH